MQPMRREGSPEPVAWQCQFNGGGAQECQPALASSCKNPPLRHCSGATGLVGVAVDEMAFVVEVVV